MASQFQFSYIPQSNSQNRKISHTSYPSLFPSKRTFNFYPQSSSPSSSSSSASPRPSIRYHNQEMTSFPREVAVFSEKEEMDDFEWNFPLYSEGGNGMESSKIGGIGMGGNGSSVGNGNLVSNINQSVSSMDVDLNFTLIKPEEIDLDLFGTSNVTLGSEPLTSSNSVSNGNFDFNSILDPILFQAQANSEVKPEFTFNYPSSTNSTSKNAGDLFTNHHLSLGTSNNSNNINESPILFSNAYDAPSQSTQPVPATSLSFIDPQTLLSPVPPAFSPLGAQTSNNVFTSPSSMTDVAVPDMSPLIPDLDRKIRGESMSSEDEDGMPQTPGGMSTLNGAFGFGGIGMMGTPLVGDESFEDTMGLFNLGGFNFSNLTGLNPSGLPGSINTSGASPLLDQNKPGMKELLKMFPGLANLDQDMLEKILTPPSSNTSHSTSSSSISQPKQQKRSISRVSNPSTGSPALEGMTVRDEIAKRRRTPAEKAAQQEREKSLAVNTEFGTPAPENRGDIRRRSSCTNNHRKLIDLDAPTQIRNYISSSTTSRKPSNTTVSKRKAALLPDGTHAIEDEQRVEKKRRQNTLSARRSRARRQEVLEMLEDRKRALNLELEEYKRRSEEAESRLKELRGDVAA